MANDRRCPAIVLTRSQVKCELVSRANDYNTFNVSFFLKLFLVRANDTKDHYLIRLF